MRGRIAIAWLLAIVGCGDDGGDATPVLLPGSPAVTRAFLHGYAIGGDSAFGLSRLLERRGDAWTPIADVSPFGARAQLFSGDAIVAVSETTLYRQDGASWTALAIPTATTAITIVGADGGAMIGAALDPDGGALVTWMPPAASWVEVPGSRPIGIGARAFLVEHQRVTWSDPARGIVRVEAGAQATIVDCTADEFGACVTPLVPLAYGADDALSILACASDAPPFAAFRVLGDQHTPIGLPANLPACAGVRSAGGTSVLATLPGDGGEGILLELGPTAKAWRRVARASPGLTYVPAGDVIDAYGDGLAARGIYELRP